MGKINLKDLIFYTPPPDARGVKNGKQRAEDYDPAQDADRPWYLRKHRGIYVRMLELIGELKRKEEEDKERERNLKRIELSEEEQQKLISEK